MPFPARRVREFVYVLKPISPEFKEVMVLSVSLIRQVINIWDESEMIGLAFVCETWSFIARGGIGYSGVRSCLIFNSG